jgi:hypothetical protein
MQPDVPPNFLGIIYAAGGDEQFQVIFILGQAFEQIGNTRARKQLEDHLAVRL